MKIKCSSSSSPMVLCCPDLHTERMRRPSSGTSVCCDCWRNEGGNMWFAFINGRHWICCQMNLLNQTLRRLRQLPLRCSPGWHRRLDRRWGGVSPWHGSITWERVGWNEHTDVCSRSQISVFSLLYYCLWLVISGIIRESMEDDDGQNSEKQDFKK